MIDNYTNSEDILRDDLLNVRALLKHVTSENLISKTDPTIKSLQRIINFVDRLANQANNATTYGVYESLEGFQTLVNSTYNSSKMVTSDNLSHTLNALISHLYKQLEYIDRAVEGSKIND